MIDRITRLVVARELHQAVRRKSTWIIAAVLALASTALVVLPSLIGGDGTTSIEVALVGSPPADLTTTLSAAGDAYGYDINFTDTTADDARSLVGDDEADLALVWGDNPVLVQRGGDVGPLEGLVEGVVQRYRFDLELKQAGVGEATINAANTVPPLDVEVIDVDRGSRQGAATAVTILMYMMVLLLASQVGSAVATDKANRVTEVLIAVAPPKRFLYGRVISAVILGIGLMSAAAIPVAIKWLVDGADLPDSIGRLLLVSIVWMIGGVGLYVMAAAVIGAMVDKVEEVGPAMAPLTIVLILVYIIAFPTAETSAGLIFSLLPISSPIMTPARVAIGAASLPEVIASAVILFVSVGLVARLAAAAYARAIVLTGRKLAWKDLRQT